jgi:hypothetical protein
MLTKAQDVLGLFLTTLKTLAPRTPVKLLRVCTNTHDTSLDSPQPLRPLAPRTAAKLLHVCTNKHNKLLWTLHNP